MLVFFPGKTVFDQISIDFASFSQNEKIFLGFFRFFPYI